MYLLGKREVVSNNVSIIEDYIINEEYIRGFWKYKDGMIACDFDGAGILWIKEDDFINEISWTDEYKVKLKEMITHLDGYEKEYTFDVTCTINARGSSLEDARYKAEKPFKDMHNVIDVNSYVLDEFGSK